jgi:predicted RNA-binding Zn ribbon-like protein
MTGETPQAQPGGRTPAPGPLALVQAFLNTHYDLDVDHGAEVWSSPEAYAGWLARHRLIAGPIAVSPVEHARALRVRAALRALASGEEDAAAGALTTLAEAGRGAAVEVRFSSADGPAFEADGTPASAVGLMLAITAQAMRDGSWERLKICPGRDCGWAFYDHSRNGSGRWCSMAICGGREKARTHYRRNRGDR